MPISPDHVGRVFGPTAVYEITAVKIAEFARALGDDNPAYRGDRAVAPPTFAAVIAAQAWDQLWADPELGLTLSRVIHADQAFQFVQPLRAGQRVRASLTIDGVRRRGPLTHLGLTVELRDQAGQLLASSASTLIHRQEEAA
ncbi:MAG: MaoC family dehydratase N-terminal domain-containing protein [Propionibacteriaceae bacterium]|jgi:acyl dehydratase|nr:MaoC family dehydratase N-terminal domain-containing protein [Propionibacteriaceae bacterium]